MSAETKPLDTVRLGVNVDHVATLRQARRTDYPSVQRAALTTMAAGAASITVHLREDRRHIQDADVEALIAADDVPVNLELAATPSMLAIATRLKPRDACLVPEKREELTTEGGLDVAGQPEAVAAAVKRLTEAGIHVALFIDPDVDQVMAAARTGVPAIELHTGAYADAPAGAARERECSRIADAAARGADLGLEVHGGHGLNQTNVGPIAAIPSIVELNIGHAIVADAIELGMADAVRAMREAIDATDCD
ncbi:pyridoxine 5'-phosphate synthase [Salinisphaera sp. USBA-960]|uniref:pyridoxine 5'-phosphate synthase n=1 Tax=Salinisphaera orenii TaxID=856731 RepID=UPI000DBE9B19|nr:pyridoxine 5'-phosphate synthase [Salifodinibacter halophilus]NNC25853.1 pyridoxine 5'-phosphate synthase [Salifodinibacter halophilus]